MSCKYCHQDFEGYSTPLDKNAHVYLAYPNILVIQFGGKIRECKINFCPMCGRKLKEETDG